MNTLANHGLVNRNGKDFELFEMAQTISNTFDLSIDFNMIIAQQTVDFGPSFTDDYGVIRVNLDRFFRHNAQQHDSSSTFKMSSLVHAFLC